MDKDRLTFRQIFAVDIAWTFTLAVISLFSVEHYYLLTSGFCLPVPQPGFLLIIAAAGVLGIVVMWIYIMVKDQRMNWIDRRPPEK